MHLTVTLALGDRLAQIRQPNITSVAGNQNSVFCIDLHAPHFWHDRRTVSAGYSRSCSEPPDIVAHSLRLLLH